MGSHSCRSYAGLAAVSASVNADGAADLPHHTTSPKPPCMQICHCVMIRKGFVLCCGSGSFLELSASQHHKRAPMQEADHHLIDNVSLNSHGSVRYCLQQLRMRNEQVQPSCATATCFAEPLSMASDHSKHVRFESLQ